LVNGQNDEVEMNPIKAVKRLRSKYVLIEIGMATDVRV